MTANRSNFLILMADQMTPAALPAYGHRVTRAPHIAALAEQGVVFDSAYCNSPLCTPSRVAFMTGQLPSKTGAHDNASEFPAAVPTFAHYLRDAGYRTILSGKMHFCGPDQLHGFEERLTTDIYPSDFGWTPDWENPARPSWYHNMTSVADAGPCIRTNQLDFDDEVVFAAERKLFDIARGTDGRPFCLVVSMTHPHDPYAIAERYWNLYRDDEIDLPRVAIDPDDLDPHSRRLRHVCDMDRSEIPERQIRNARRAYYGAISYVDAQIGRLRRALEETAMARDTVILILADHGDMLGERGLWYKMSFFEGAARVPLIVHAPERFRPGRVAASVSLIDILPTLLDLAAGPSASLCDPIDGRSLLPHLEGKAGHDEVLGEYLAEGAVAPLVMIRRERWKFIHAPVDPDQLYDLATDPDERTNLAAREAQAPLVRAFRDETAARWNLPRLHEAVLASQRRRRFVYRALGQGAHRSWDYQPFQDAGQQYVRNHRELDALEATARFPHVTSAPEG